MDTLDRARKYLAKLPIAVSGQFGHNATFRAACALVRNFGLAETDAMSLLREWNNGCQPPWSERELEYKVKSALAVTGTRTPARDKARSRPAPSTTVPKRSQFVPATLKRIAALLPSADEQYIKDRSPVHPDTQTPASFLHRLFRSDECVVVFDVFKSQGRHICRRVDPPYDAGCLNHLINGCPDGMWFLCNPVDGEFHPNPRLGGKRSRRSEESVTAWRYLVVESDVAEAADWLAALVQMPLRIAAIYTSGGHSIHALVRVDAASKADWDAMARKLKPVLAVLGADPAAITAVRLTRLPGCYRGQEGPRAPKHPPVRKRWVDSPLEFDASGDPIWTPAPNPELFPANRWTGGKLQRLLYLDPDPSGEPICRKPTRQEIYERWLAAARGESQEASQ